MPLRILFLITTPFYSVLFLYKYIYPTYLFDAISGMPDSRCLNIKIVYHFFGVYFYFLFRYANQTAI